MSEILTEKEKERLAEIGKDIRFSLECDINGTGLPCQTDRLESIKLMIEYLEIHNLEVTNKGEHNGLRKNYKKITRTN